MDQGEAQVDAVTPPVDIFTEQRQKKRRDKSSSRSGCECCGNPTEQMRGGREITDFAIEMRKTRTTWHQLKKVIHFNL